ncbi:MAG TPA: thymidylate kinase [Gemmatimonadota bacterium]|nr:thymidylate kinase [Gemmatimonadota bacterium]
MVSHRTYKHVIPGIDMEELGGLLIVIEGPDSSGRSTQIWLLSRWLEQLGFAVEQMGLKRSKLVANELEKAKEGNVLSPRTMALFYATDFYDQLENRIVPALRAGSVVLADRYVYTLMARDMIRGAHADWLKPLYSMAVVPDAVYLLDTSAENILDRTLSSRGKLDYWESGMDLGLARDWYESFTRYQENLRLQFEQIMTDYPLERIHGDRPILEIHEDLKSRIERILPTLTELHRSPPI